MKAFIKNLVKKLNSDTIVIEGDPYLTRYYLFGRDFKWGNIYIHHFHSSDKDPELHNHPWKWALSFIWDGGYDEQYRVGDEVHVRTKAAPTFNIVKHGAFHRVKLHDEENGTWSIFFTGPRVTEAPEWGFWDKDTKEFIYFKERPHSIP
jgi:hypothetical protein